LAARGDVNLPASGTVSQNGVAFSRGSALAGTESALQQSVSTLTYTGPAIEHNDLHICSECLVSEARVQYYEWCGDGQISGGGLEDSYHLGCEPAKGKPGRSRTPKVLVANGVRDLEELESASM